MNLNALKSQFSIFALVILCLSSCQKVSSALGEGKDCPSANVSLMFTVDDMEARFKEVGLSQTSQKELIVGLIDSLNFMTKSIIERTGGIAKNGDLFNGCKPAKYQFDFFEKYRVNQIGEMYKKINVNDSLGLHVIDVLNRNFYAPYKFFTKAYFEQVTINRLTSDLLTMQLSLINYEGKK